MLALIDTIVMALLAFWTLVFAAYALWCIANYRQEPPQAGGNPRSETKHAPDRGLRKPRKK